MVGGLRPRAEHLSRLRSERFQLVVVGGGITGAGIALDAAARGLKVALVEKADFGSGTSSRSSKLIHGGLRYLAQGHVRLTREALAERDLLSRLAPHLVQTIPFLFPIHRGLGERAMLAAGLTLYDTLGGSAGAGPHRWRDAAELQRRLLGMSTDGLRGGYEYYDARTDDARLVLEVLRAAAARGAAAANYVQVERFLRRGGRACGVAATDRLSGQSWEIQAEQVVVASGVWLDRLLPPGQGGRLRPSKGVHLFLPIETLFADAPAGSRQAPLPALYLHTGADGRLIFVIPWQGRLMVGTTDTDYCGDLDAPTAEAEDVGYLLEAMRRAFPGAALTPDRVLATHAGLRPLVAADDEATSALSRDERLFETDDGMVAIAGGKLTTFRRMAARAVDAAARLAGWPLGAGSGGAATASLPLAGYPAALTPHEYARWEAQARLRGIGRGLGYEAAGRLIQRYGGHVDAAFELIEADPSLAAPLLPEGGPLRVEVVVAARYEMAQTLADVLVRRTRVALLAADQGLSVAPAAAALMARELGWTEQEVAEQLAAYAREVRQFRVPRP